MASSDSETQAFGPAGVWPARSVPSADSSADRGDFFAFQQDIFQEVFLRLVKNIDSIQNEEHLKSWLIRVTLNCSKTNLM
ncbi:MAG: hypothetical protein IIW12_03060, partial [Oscillospiraceae bacterium]|nr:hypothetical protein [Oscillospiraceae bacterium]